jgi:hypothetical protein
MTRARRGIPDILPCSPELEFLQKSVMTREFPGVRSHVNAPPPLRQRFGPFAESYDKRWKRGPDGLRKEMYLHNDVSV